MANFKKIKTVANSTAALLAAVFISSALIWSYAFQLYVGEGRPILKNEDLYWTVAHLQLEIEKTRATLMKYKTGTASRDELALRYGLVISRKIDMETPGTELHTLLASVPGYTDIVALINKELPTDQVRLVTDEGVIAAFDRLGRIQRELSLFALNARKSEISYRQARNDELYNERYLVAALAIALWLVTCISLVVLRSRYVKTRTLLEQEQAAHQATVAMELDRTTFFATLSHEIRSPLQSMQAYLTLIESHTKSEGKARDALNGLKASMNGLIVQVHDIMDFSAIKNMQLRVSPSVVNMAKLFQEVLDIQRVIASNKNLALLYEAEQLPRSVRVDGDRLRQVVGNLVANAIRYTAHGQVTIKVGLLYSHGKTLIQVAVMDTGIGIPPDMQQKIFQPYVRGSKLKGSHGLGLALVKELVGLMGGTVELHSREGVGSTFTVCIPVVVLNEAVNDTPTILVVEDDASIRLPFVELLSEEGYQVLAAGTVDEAKHVLDEQPALDLVLLDMQLGADSGYDVAEAIRSSQNAVPILAMTAHPQEYNDKRAAWFAEKLEKPFSFPQLIALVHQRLITRHNPQRELV